jgi:integration host factor subunit beta
MVRSELMLLLAQQCSHLPQKDVVVAGNLILLEMEKALCKLDRIEFRGIGSICVRIREERIAHNPLTRKKVATPRKFRAHFKAGKALRQRVDRGRAQYPQIKSHTGAIKVKKKQTEEVA